VSGEYEVLDLPADLAQELIAEGLARPVAIRGPMIETVQLFEDLDLLANLITVGVGANGFAALCRRLTARRRAPTITVRSRSGLREIPIPAGVEPDDLEQALRNALDGLEDDE
jgi:hypothetical protein